MPRISLVMIVKNEESMLPGCLASVKGAVDETIVVDTGSTDRTRDIATEHGAKVIDYLWADDFAAARNVSLEHATGEWVLQLDADERLLGTAAATLRKAVGKATFDCGLVRLHNAAHLDAPASEVVQGRQRLGEPTLLPRLMRRTADLRYRGIIHENVEDWIVARGKKIQVLGIDLLHLGQTAEIRAGRGKSERNLALLRKRCREETDNIIPFGYLAMELIFAGELVEALRVAEQGWQLLDSQPKHRSPLRLAIARARLMLSHGDPNAAIESVGVAQRSEGSHPDLMYLLGCAMEMQGRNAPHGSHRQRRTLEAARRSFVGALEMRGVATQGQFIAGATSWAARTRLGTVLLLLEQPEAAMGVFAQAMAEKPDNSEAALGTAEAALEQGRFAEAFELVELLVDEHPDRLLLAAEAAEGLEAFPEMQRLLAGTKPLMANGYVARHRAHRHVEASMALALFGGTPFSGPGRLGLLGALMSREPVRSDAERPTTRDLVRAAKLVLLGGHGALLAPLFEARAEALVPGITAELRTILGAWGLDVEDDGVPEPVFVLGTRAEPTQWVAGMLDAHPSLRAQGLTTSLEEALRDGSPLALAPIIDDGETGRIVWRCPPRFDDVQAIGAVFPRARLVHVVAEPNGGAGPVRVETRALREALRQAPVAHREVDYDALLADPLPQIEWLLAFLGESTDEQVLRHLILEYPGRRRAAKEVRRAS